MYEFLLHSDAEQIYFNADQALPKKITRFFQQLEQTPRSHPNVDPSKQIMPATIAIELGTTESFTQ